MLWLSGSATSAAGQAAPPGTPAAAGGREADPVQCWTRTSASAVRIGERLAFVLTCAVVDTPTLKVFVDESRLDPNAAQFPPFEVVAGHHGPDLHQGDRRFFQYVYDLRIIDDSLFGKTATVPAVSLSYRIETGTERGSSNAGIERTYLAPAQPVRVLALVGDDPGDIRDAEPTTFDELSQAAMHASGLVTAGGVVFGLAALFAVAAVVRAATHGRATGTAAEHRPRGRAVVRAVRKELAAIRREREERGWSPALADRLSAALRIAGRFLLDQPVTYRPVEANAPKAAAGALGFEAGFGKPVLVWGTVTSETLAAAAPVAPPFRRTQIERLEAELRALSRAQYGRDEAGPPVFDAALELGDELAGALGREQGLLAMARARIASLGRRQRP